VVGSCEHRNEPLDSTKGGEILDSLSDCWLLRNSSSWSQLHVHTTRNEHSDSFLGITWHLLHYRFHSQIVMELDSSADAIIIPLSRFSGIR
jgi:hypothetical protein